MTKSRRKRQAGHVASMGEIRDDTKILNGKPEGTISFEDPGLDKRIILE